MNRLIRVNSIPYIFHRGKLVRVTEEWMGKTVHAQTIRKRKGKRGQGRQLK